MPGTSAISKSLLIIIIAVGLANVTKPAPCSSQNPTASYELIYETDETTEQTGSLTLKCRNGDTAEVVGIDKVSFFLNHSSAADRSLREREDISVIEVGSPGVKFNLTRRLEGYYTCGKRVTCTNVTESPPKALISLQTIVPLLHPLKTNFTVMSGDRVVLPCPIQPGALLQQYSVRWSRGSTPIAEATNPQSITTVDSRYNIDRDNYSLIIDSANINDTSSDYQCELSVTNPNSNTLQMLQSSPSVTLSLKVYADDEEPTDPGDSTTENLTDPASVPIDDPLVNLWCTCQQHKKPLAL